MVSVSVYNPKFSHQCVAFDPREEKKTHEAGKINPVKRAIALALKWRVDRGLENGLVINAAAILLINKDGQIIAKQAATSHEGFDAEILAFSKILSIDLKIPLKNRWHHDYIEQEQKKLKELGCSVVTFSERAPCQDPEPHNPKKPYSCTELFERIQQDVPVLVCYAIPPIPNRATDPEARNRETLTLGATLGIAVMAYKELQSDAYRDYRCPIPPLPVLTDWVKGRLTCNINNKPQKLILEESLHRFRKTQGLPLCTMTTRGDVSGEKSIDLEDCDEPCTILYMEDRVIKRGGHEYIPPLIRIQDYENDLNVLRASQKIPLPGITRELKDLQDLIKQHGRGRIPSLDKKEDGAPYRQYLIELQRLRARHELDYDIIFLDSPKSASGTDTERKDEQEPTHPGVLFSSAAVSAASAVPAKAAQLPLAQASTPAKAAPRAKEAPTAAKRTDDRPRFL